VNNKKTGVITMSFNVCNKYVPKEFHQVLNHTRTESIFKEKKLKDSKTLLKFFEALLKNKWQSDEKLKALTLACREAVRKKELHGDAKKIREKLVGIYHKAKVAPQKPKKPILCFPLQELQAIEIANLRNENEALKKEIAALKTKPSEPVEKPTAPVVEKPVSKDAPKAASSPASTTTEKPVVAATSSSSITTTSVSAVSTLPAASTSSIEGFPFSFPTITFTSAPATSSIPAPISASTSVETLPAASSASTTTTTTTTITPPKTKKPKIVKPAIPSTHTMTLRSGAKAATEASNK
jgi:hypothetical protein